MTTADDFGWDDDTVHATIELLERGIVRNASIMANVPASAAALAYARANPQHGWGVHLTLTRDEDEAPLSPLADVADLVDATGRFWPGRSAQIRAAAGRFPSDQLRTELRAQLDMVVGHGITIDYVDSHKHLHKYPAVARALEDILPEYGVGTVRRPQNRFVGRRHTRPSAWLEPLLRRRLVTRWTTTDQFFMADGDPAVAWWEHIHPGERGSLEIGCHPGRRSAWRDHERRGIEAVVETLTRHGVRPRRWRDLTRTYSGT